MQFSVQWSFVKTWEFSIACWLIIQNWQKLTLKLREFLLYLKVKTLKFSTCYYANSFQTLFHVITYRMLKIASFKLHNSPKKLFSTSFNLFSDRTARNSIDWWMAKVFQGSIQMPQNCFLKVQFAFQRFCRVAALRARNVCCSGVSIMRIT